MTIFVVTMMKGEKSLLWPRPRNCVDPHPIRKLYGITIMCCRSDDGGIFISLEFKTFIRSTDPSEEHNRKILFLAEHN